jgi:hypothetical protein
MKLSEVKEVSPLKPAKEGNLVFLKSLPEYIEGDKGDSYKIEFVDEDGKTFSQTIFDPFNTPDTVKEALVQAGFTKIMRFVRAFMTTETYNTFAETDFPDLKTLLNTFKRDVAKDWASTQARIIFGFRTYDGFLSLPTFTNWISTKYAEDNDLTYPEDELSLTYVANPKKPRPVKDATTGATPDKEVKKSVSDEV